MDSLRRLEEIFAISRHRATTGSPVRLLPPRQAPAFIKEFTSLIEEVKKSTAECPQCHRLFIGGNNKTGKSGASNICSICSDANRDASTLMVVARDSDFESIEKSAAYKGLYFILGGTVPILDKEPDKRIRLNNCLKEFKICAERDHSFFEYNA